MRTGFLEREQFEAVRRRLPAPLRPLVTVGYVTGWRIDSEVLPLEWRHVDFAGGEIRLDPSMAKNGEGRVFPFTPEFREVFEAQRAACDALVAAGHVCP